jgi:vesicle transport through interaction with t-SNAREs protein 1
MSNLIDADAGTERFGGYEAELKLVQADLNQQIEQIKETTGEPRKAAISRAERALEEADELVSLAYWCRMRWLWDTSPTACGA